MIFATLNASTIVNDIQSEVYRNSPLVVQNSSYTNLNGTWNVNGFFNYGFPLAHPKSNLNFMTGVTLYTESDLAGFRTHCPLPTGLFFLLRIHEEYGSERNDPLDKTNIKKKNFDMRLYLYSTWVCAINKKPRRGHTRNALLATPPSRAVRAPAAAPI